MTLVVLFLVNLLNFYDRLTLGAIAEPMRREFQLSDAQLGGLTTAFTILYALAGWPLGRLADTKSRKGILAWGVAVWSGLTALGGLASSYAMLLFTRIGVGIGEAACAPAATSWIADATPPERRTRALAWFMMAIPVGGMLSYSIGGPAAQAFGWRAALALAGLPAVALIPAILWLREPKRARLAATAPSPRVLAGMPVFWWIAVSGAVVNFALYSFSAFFPAFLTRFHHLSVAGAGVWAGVGTGIAGIAGALCAGVAGDRVTANLARHRMRLAAVASLAAAPLAFFAIAMPAGSAASAIALMMVAYGLLQMYYGPVYAAMQDAVAPELRGTAMGGYFVVQYLGGAAWGPLLTGRLSDHFARAAVHTGATAEAARGAGLHQAMYAIPALALLLAAVLWMGSLTANRSASPLRPAVPRSE
jgi:MFS family permease